MPRFPSAQGRVNHEPDSTLAVTKTCPKDGVHLWSRNRKGRLKRGTSRLLKKSVKQDRQIDPGVLPCSQH